MFLFPVFNSQSSSRNEPLHLNSQPLEIIELQRPEPTHQPGRTPGSTTDLDAFVSQQSQNPHNLLRDAQIALLVNPPSDPDEFFRRLDDIEAQAASQLREAEILERPPSFDQPPTYDETVPAPTYKAGFKRTVKNHASLIVMGGVMLSALITLVATCSVLTKGSNSNNNRNFGNH